MTLGARSPLAGWTVRVLIVITVFVSIASLWRLARDSEMVDFSTFYTAGVVAGTEEWAQVYDREPTDTSKTPREGAMARTARAAGYFKVPGQYIQAPAVLFMFRPLGWFAYRDAFLLNATANVGALLVVVWLCASMSLPGCTLEVRGIAFAALLAVAALAHPIRYNIMLGNHTEMVLLSVVLAYWLDRRGHPVLGGLALGTGVIVKPAPALLILYFLLRGRWRTAVATVVTVAAWMALGVAMYGIDMHVRWVEILRHHSGSTYVAWNNQSILGALLRLSVPVEMLQKWEVVLAPPGVLWVHRVLVVAGLAWWLAGFRRWRSPTGEALGYGGGLLWMMMASPYAWTHYYAVFLWPLATVGARIMQSWNAASRWRMALLAVITAGWIVNPERVLRFMTHDSIPMIAQTWVTPILVSNTLGAAFLIFVWLQCALRLDADVAVAPAAGAEAPRASATPTESSR